VSSSWFELFMQSPSKTLDTANIECWERERTVVR